MHETSLNRIWKGPHMYAH